MMCVFSVDLINIDGSDYVYKALLSNPGYDFEYYIEGTIDGDVLTYPVTGGSAAHNINKTVIGLTEVPFVPTELESANIPKPIDEIALLVYPNPTQDYFILALEQEIRQIQVFNAKGQLLLEENNVGGQIGIADFSSGIYFVRVITDDFIGNAKLIKH